MCGHPDRTSRRCNARRTSCCSRPATRTRFVVTWRFLPREPAAELCRSAAEGARPMELRPELTPPALDERLVARLTKLAAHLDGNPDEEAMRAEFNRLAGTDIPMEEFQQVYEGEGH